MDCTIVNSLGRYTAYIDMKANNNEVMETAKDKFLKKVEDTLKTYCIESFMDDVIGDDISDIYADIECLMDEAKESNNKDALADLTAAYKELQRAERSYCDEVNSNNK